MKQLRFTTSEPGFMGASGSALVEERGEVTFTPTKYGTIYIDDEAERLAGYDIPKFLSGDTAQVDRPIEEQDIVMVLPSGEYPCIAEVVDSIPGKQYYLHLKKKDMQKVKLVFTTETSPLWKDDVLFREKGTDRIFRGFISNGDNNTLERIYPIYISNEERIEPGDKIYGGLGRKPKVCDVNLKEGESLKPGYFHSYKIVPIHKVARRKFREQIIKGRLGEGDMVSVAEI